jgi:molybdopterin synthase sulfur carrier subunit
LKLRILYFARLRDAMGHGQEQVDVPAGIGNVGELRAWLMLRGSPWREAFVEVRAIRAAVDQVMGDDGAVLRDGSEVAFFPPVTGG